MSEIDFCPLPCLLAYGFVNYSWNSEEVTFKFGLKIKRIIRAASRYLGAGKVGGNEKRKANDGCISRTQFFIATQDFSNMPTVICTQMNKKKCNSLFLCIVLMCKKSCNSFNGSNFAR